MNIKKMITLALVLSSLAINMTAMAEELPLIATQESALETKNSDDIKVKYNDVEIAFDVEPQIVDGRTLVPMRKIFETLGANVSWIEAEQGIVAIKGSKIMTMKIGANMMIVSDVATSEENKITLDVPPIIVDNRTLVPVRAISEGLGVKVDWIAETKTVLLSE